MNTIDACDTQTAIEPTPHRVIDAELAHDLAKEMGRVSAYGLLGSALGAGGMAAEVGVLGSELLAALASDVRKSTAEEVACDCARLRLEVAQLKRTEALLREADDRQRLAIAEQAAAIGALQEKLKITERQLLVLRAEEVLWRVVLTRAEQERDASRRELDGLRARVQPICGSAGCTTCLPTLARIIDPEARRALNTILEEVPP